MPPDALPVVATIGDGRKEEVRPGPILDFPLSRLAGQANKPLNHLEQMDSQGKSMTQVTVNLDDEIYRALDKQRKETGLSMSMLIQLRLRGKEVRDVKPGH